MGDFIDIIGFSVCAILMFAWIESRWPRSKRKKKEDFEKAAKARRDLINAIEKHNKRKE